MIPITAGILGGAGAAGGHDRRTRRGLTGAVRRRVRAGLRAARAAGRTHRLALRRGQLQSLGVLPHGQPAPGVRAGPAGRLYGGRAPDGCGAGRRGFGAGSPGGAFAMGAACGLVAAPCGAPAFAAVLTFVAATGSAVLGFIYLFVFSLGLTALLVVVGLSSGAARGAAACGTLDPLGQARRRRPAPAAWPSTTSSRWGASCEADRARHACCSPCGWPRRAARPGRRARGRTPRRPS